MSYEVSQIQGYVEQKKSELVGKAVMGAKTIGKIGIQTGVKGNTALNQMTTNFSFKDGPVAVSVQRATPLSHSVFWSLPFWLYSCSSAPRT